MTPNGIEILIHFHVCPLPHPRLHAPAVVEEIESFLRNGLIKEIGPGHYRTTERGAAHIAQLCNVPWPKQVWIDEQGRFIDVRRILETLP